MRSLPRLLPVLSVVVWAGACVAAAPTAGSPAGPPGGMPDMKRSGADLARPDDGRAQTPTLDPIDAVTPYASAPVHGIAEAGSTVIIKATNGSVVAAEVDGGGRFCADVMLKKDTANVFALSAIDAYGNTSDSIDLTITQRGTPTSSVPPTAVVATNVSLGGAPAVAHIGVISSGPAAYANDDNPQSAVEGHYLGNLNPFAAAGSGSVVVKLAARSRLDRIHAIAPTDCPFTAPVDLYYSDASAPSPPDVQPMAWSKLTPQKSNGNLELDAPTAMVTATHVAILWPIEAGDYNCGWVGPTYGLAELQAWTVPNVAAPPPPAAPSCSAGL